MGEVDKPRSGSRSVLISQEIVRNVGGLSLRPRSNVPQQLDELLHNGPRPTLKNVANHGRKLFWDLSDLGDIGNELFVGVFLVNEEPSIADRPSQDPKNISHIVYTHCQKGSAVPLEQLFLARSSIVVVVFLRASSLSLHVLGIGVVV